MSSTICMLQGVPIVMMGSLKPQKMGTPGWPYLLCTYFRDTIPDGVCCDKLQPMVYGPSHIQEYELGAWSWCHVIGFNGALIIIPGH